MNYCRQIKQQLQSNGYKNNVEGLYGLLANESVKFILPHGGIMIDDKNLRGVDESMPLRLPYKTIALEFSGDTKTKQVVFAKQNDTQEKIYIYVSIHVDGHGWIFHDIEFSIPMNGYMDRSKIGFMDYPVLKLHDRDAGWLPDDSNFGCQRVLFAFINALSCSNTRIEKLEPKKHAHQIKPALQFDTYHYLTIGPSSKSCGQSTSGGSHRSPREHLRRGHIRQLEDKKIWVNATIVAAGSKGVVTKDYKVT